MDFYVNGDAAPGGRFNFIFTTGNTTSISENRELPGHFLLSQNYPNPFNPTTNITYKLAKKEPVELSVYDITGRKIKVLVDTVQNAGAHEVRWSAENLSSGVYLLALRAGADALYRKMLLVK